MDEKRLALAKERARYAESKGYVVLATLVTNDDRHGRHMVRCPDGRRAFLKIAEMPEQVRALETEHLAAAYFREVVERSYGAHPWERWCRKLISNVPQLAFPHTAFRIEDGRGVLESTWIEGRDGMHPKASRLRPVELASVARLVAALHGPSPLPLPAALALVAPFHTDRAYAESLEETYLVTAHREGVLALDETTVISHVFNEAPPMKRVFAHRDIWEPNLIRGEDGRLWLIDAEFARWAMPGMDAVHFFLQTRIFRDNARVARDGFIEMYEAIHDVRPSIAEEIWPTFLYGIGCAAARVAGQTLQVDLVRKLVTLILVRDLERILAV